MAEDTANTQKPCDTGQRYGNIGQCGELGDQDTNNGADKAQHHARDDRQQILHGDNSFQSVNEYFLPTFYASIICKGAVNIITDPLRFGYSFGYKMVTNGQGNFFLCLHRIFAIIILLLVIWCSSLFDRSDPFLNYLQNLWNALDLGSLRDTLLRVAAVLICLILHETCHGIAAFFLGDPTAKRNHRLSLNPLRHIDWIGLAAMVLTGVGWAKPVPVNPNYFKHPKQGMAITALAGPVSNLLLALWLLLGARLMYTHGVETGELNETLFYFLMNTALMSIGLGVFNLIPIPPLDGSKVLAVLLPDRQYNWLMRYERFGMLILMALVCFGALSNVLDTAIGWVFQLFCRIVGFY